MKTETARSRTMVQMGVGIQGSNITTAVEAFNTLIAPSGRSVQVVRRYRNWSDTLIDQAGEDALNAGRRPWFVPHAFDPNMVSIPWADIAAGKYDSRLQAWADELKAAGYPPCILTWHHEPEDDTLSQTSGGQGRCGEAPDFVASWLHFRNFMRKAGVPRSIPILVCLMGGTFRSRTRNPADWITPEMNPDAIASDGYSRDESSGQKPKTFVDIFGPAHDFAVNYVNKRGKKGKPFYIEECGVAEVAADPTFKPAWYRGAIPSLQAWGTTSPGKLTVFEYSEVMADNFGGQDYRFETSPESLTAALEMVAALP